MISGDMTDEERAALPPGAGGVTLALFRIERLAKRLEAVESAATLAQSASRIIAARDAEIDELKKRLADLLAERERLHDR